MTTLFRVRAGVAADRNFVLATWATSYHDAHDVRAVPYALYSRRMARRVSRILDRSTLLVAHLPDDPTHILGWLVAEDAVLHYVFVRRARRGYGVARALLVAQYHEASHSTKSGARLIRALGLRYNPLAQEGPAS